jgi:protein HOOK3
MKNYEENLDDGISREREVRPTLPLTHFTTPPLQVKSILTLLQMELQRTIDDQARELNLVTSAWYHLQSRWQNNNMTISRYRHGANMTDPRGWLAKQRSVVAGQ